MTTPRFEPKAYCVRPKDFGRRGVEFLDPDDLHPDERNRVWVAKLQSEVASKLRDRMLYADLTLEEVASDLGMTASRLGRLIRGEIVLRLEDLADLDRELGVDLRELLPV